MAKFRITPPASADKYQFRMAVVGKFKAEGIGATSDPATGIVTTECAEIPIKVQTLLDTQYRGYLIEADTKEEDTELVRE